MPVRIVLLPGVALPPLLIVIMPTMSSVVSSHMASFIIVAVLPALIIPTHVLIEEVIRGVVDILCYWACSSSPFSHCDLSFSRRTFIFACVNHGNHALEFILVDIRVALFIR
ncbi:hypothetical protein QYE76_043488 [Lolium multiflorum]|uniref:Uncharacterized protein n=1 Tax=Lolium multiflorum TaxID=4521 RepID=A0AAD8TGN9_LOLMU|nr:hypothetical protein QYE76_043488 [Lolium multiflorum]